MERIVNGIYNQEHSTRDVIGMLPNEFAFLIDLLQEKYKLIETLFQLPDDKLLEMVNLNQDILRDHDIDSVNFNADRITRAKTQLANQYGMINKFLEEINQPYPGAEYDFAFDDDDNDE